MIGTLFILFNLVTMGFVGLQEADIGLKFVDYYHFRRTYFEYRHDFLLLWGWHLLLFLLAYVALRKIVFWPGSNDLIAYNKATHWNQSKEPKLVYGILFTVLNIAFLHLQYGSFLYVRDSYQPDLNFNLFYVLYILTLFLSLVYLQFCKSRAKYMLTLVVILFSFAIATRITGVVLVFISIVEFCRRNYFESFVLLLSGLFSIVLALYLRSMEHQGAINYIMYFSFADMSQYILPIISYTINFNFYLSIATYFDFLDKGVTLSDYTVSLNPLPGVMVGWYDGMNQKHAVLPVVPYSSWGMVLALGKFGSSLFFVFLAVVLAYMDSVVKKERVFLSVLVTICGMLFIVYFSQYQLRSSFRYIYYALFVIFFVRSKRNILQFLLYIKKRGHSYTKTGSL